MCKIETTIFFILALFAAGRSGNNVVIDSLFVRDNRLNLSYHINNLLDDKGVQALERGITSEVVHHIQLWRQKSFINPMEKEYIYSVKLFYDSWEKKYRILSDDENRLTSHLETVKEKCSVLESFPIAPLGELERGGKYFISINVTFQPISAESYNAISDIFNNDEKKRETKKNKKNGFLGVLVNLLGFGDKEFSVKSQDFIITEKGTVRFVK